MPDSEEEMDRREALKKIGVGGAAAVGASLVISSPAFAFDAPTVTGLPATFTLRKLSAATAELSATGFPAGTCPASATNTGDVPLQGAPSYTWTTPATPSGTGALVTRGGGNWKNGDVVTATVTVAYTCVYPTGQKPRSYRWSQTFTTDGGGNGGNFNGGGISGPTPV
jgi:hypothetical protein